MTTTKKQYKFSTITAERFDEKDMTTLQTTSIQYG